MASDHAHVRLADLSSLKPHQVGASRRPRTEARPRRKDARKWKKGIDKPRPVTEAKLSKATDKGAAIDEAMEEFKIDAANRFRLIPEPVE